MFDLLECFPSKHRTSGAQLKSFLASWSHLKPFSPHCSVWSDSRLWEDSWFFQFSSVSVGWRPLRRFLWTFCGEEMFLSSSPALWLAAVPSLSSGSSSDGVRVETL